MRDVTKTKPSHHRGNTSTQAAPKVQGPTTFAGQQLAAEVAASAIISAETKAKLTLEIAEHEATHGSCTQTFLKKVRKQIRPRA